MEPVGAPTGQLNELWCRLWRLVVTNWHNISFSVFWDIDPQSINFFWETQFIQILPKLKHIFSRGAFETTGGCTQNRKNVVNILWLCSKIRLMSPPAYDTDNPNNHLTQKGPLKGQQRLSESVSLLGFFFQWFQEILSYTLITLDRFIMIFLCMWSLYWRCALKQKPYFPCSKPFYKGWSANLRLRGVQILKGFSLKS